MVEALGETDPGIAASLVASLDAVATQLRAARGESGSIVQRLDPLRA